MFLLTIIDIQTTQRLWFTCRLQIAVLESILVKYNSEWRYQREEMESLGPELTHMHMCVFLTPSPNPLARVRYEDAWANKPTPSPASPHGVKWTSLYRSPVWPRIGGRKWYDKFGIRPTLVFNHFFIQSLVAEIWTAKVQHNFVH